MSSILSKSINRFAAVCGGTVTCSSCLDLTLYIEDIVRIAMLLLSRNTPESMHTSKSTVVLLSTVHGLYVCYDRLATNRLRI